MFNMISKVLYVVLGPISCKQLLSAAINGAANMTYRHRGVVKRLQAVCKDGKICLGVYRFLCTPKQLDLIVKLIMSGVLKFSFRDSLVCLVEYLGSQVHLGAEMGTTCSSISPTRWHSMERATGWIVEHCDRT